MKRVTRENTDDGVETHLIRCSCSTHLLQVTVFDDDLGDPFGQVFLGILGTHPNVGRLRALWHVLRYGTTDLSEVVLHHDGARELAEIIHEMADKVRDGEI